MVNFLIAFLSVFFSGQQASVLFGFSGSMTKATNAANYIFWLEELQPTIRETPENYTIGPDNFSSISLEKLQFSYPLRPHARVLRGIDLHVRFPLLFPPSPRVMSRQFRELKQPSKHRLKKASLSRSSGPRAAERAQ